MLVDPVMPEYARTSRLLIPTATARPSVAPIPTVIPDIPFYEEAGHAGMVTLWVVFVLMLLSTLAFIGMAWRVPVEKRLFHVITAFITAFATISYFAMATGDGISFTYMIPMKVHKHTGPPHQDVFRQVFWARYVDWALTTPLLLLNLAFVAGLNGADITVAIVADIIMVLTGLFAAFGHNNTQRWGYYVIAWLAYFVVVYRLAVGGRRSVAARGTATAKLFSAIGGYTLTLWTIYPIIWALGVGSDKLSVDSEIIVYAILDVLAKAVFGFWLLTTHARSAAAASVDGFWSRGLNHEGTVRLDDDEGA